MKAPEHHLRKLVDLWSKAEELEDASRTSKLINKAEKRSDKLNRSSAEHHETK